MRTFLDLPKLRKGDKIAVLSPSYAAPGRWPDTYQLGLSRLQELFGLVPVTFPATAKLGASGEERAKDLIDAFNDSSIKGVIASLVGNDQVTYIKNLPREPFINNPKPFFGYSDNTHLINHLWLCGIPSYYGGSLFVEFAEPGSIHPFTFQHLNRALFESGEFEISPSMTFSDEGLDWNDPSNLKKHRHYFNDDGWFWDGGDSEVTGTLWGGCVESIDELLSHNISIPTKEDFKNCILAFETSEALPSMEFVSSVLNKIGEKGLLTLIKGVFFGRPKAWEFDNKKNAEEKLAYKRDQRTAVIQTIRRFNPECPIVQNMDFGHTLPQMQLPFGKSAKLDPKSRKISLTY